LVNFEKQLLSDEITKIAAEFMKNYDKRIIVTASILAAITIAFGAFGAHALKYVVSENNIVTFETGVRYQMYHVLALFVLGFQDVITAKAKKWICIFFLAGIILFSGSIYLLALNQILPFFDFKKLGFLTPIGGLLFICGWLRLAYAAFSLKKR